MPEFILRMEKGHKKATCANIPTKDAYMATIITHSIRATQASPLDKEV